MKNTLVKVLSLVMALTMIVATLGTVTVFAADECNHTKGTLIETKAPTCQKPGFSRYTCAKCNEEFTADVIQPSDAYHNIEEVDAIAASCLTPGYTAGKRCTVEGCDEIDEGCELITSAPQKAHVFVGTEYEPTCTTAGKVVYTCSLCGKTAKWLKDNNKLLDTQLAEYTTKWADKSTGKDAIGHNYEWAIVTAPVNTNGTCADGLSKGVCANCGDEKTAVIPVTHNYVLINATNLPCVEWNNQAKWCSNCKKIQPGDENKKQETVGHNSAVAYAGKLDPSNATFLAYNLKLADLYALGLTQNQDLYVAASCTTAGYQLVKCSCGELRIKTLPATNHSWSDWSAYSVPTQCTEASVKTRTCSVCSAEETSVYAAAAASAHATNVVVTAPHCLDMGYTTTTCTNKFVVNGVEYTCALNVVSNYVDPVGHSYGDVTLKSGDCKDGEYVQYCVREGCEEKNGVVERSATATTAQKTHSWNTVNVAATCQKVNYQYKQCTKCEYYYSTSTTVSATLVELAVEGAQKNANNHVYEHVRWASGTAPTCADATAVEVVKCEVCANTEITRTVNNPVEHTWDTGYVTVSGSTKTFHEDGLAATCKNTGFKADGVACTVCKAVKTAPTVTAKNPANHDDAPTDAKKVGAYVSATCKAAGYQKYYLNCCGDVTVVNPEDPKKANCTDGYITVTLVAATCTANGNHKYVKCQWCNTVKPDSVDTTGCTQCTAAQHETAEFNNNPVINKLGHDFSVNVAKAIENNNSTATTCDDTTIKAHKKCSRCAAVQLNGVVYANATKAEFLAVARELPHYDLYKQTFTAKAATCTATGIDGSRAFCTVCEKDQWIISKTAHNFAQGKEFRINYIDVSTSSTPNWKIEDCTKDACVVNECKDCSERQTVYTKAADANHNWSSWTNDTFTGFTCKNDKTQSRYCQDCGDGSTTRVETKLQTNGAATGCYTTKGVSGTNATKYYINYACDEIAAFIGWTCDVCHDTVDKTDLVHNVITTSVAPTCTADGYNISYCTGCGLNEAADALDFVEPVYVAVKPSGALLENAPAIDYNHDEVNGIILETTADYVKYICADCGETITRVIPKPAPTLTKTFAVSANKVAAGETIKVTYTYAGKADKVANETVLVEYDTDLFTLVGVETTLEGLYPVSSVVYDGVNVALIVEPKADGTAREIATTAEGTVVFTVTLKANKTAYGDEVVAGKNVKILAVGDLNGSGYVTAEDAQALFQYIGTNNVAADVNLDGVVTLADVIALAKFAASNKTAADYFEMVGELDKLEDMVYALLDSGKINDFNGDRAINNADALYFIAALNEVLVRLDYDEIGYYGDAATLAEFIAYINTYFGLEM